MSVTRPSRRGFLLGSALASGALVLGFSPRGAGAQGARGRAFTPYIRIGSDGTVTILSAHMEMGQGIYHDASPRW